MPASSVVVSFERQVFSDDAIEAHAVRNSDLQGDILASRGLRKSEVALRPCQGAVRLFGKSRIRARQFFIRHSGRIAPADLQYWLRLTVPLTPV
jgi:hypothetical protein